MPKSALTGTEKKGKKANLKAIRDIVKGKYGGTSIKDLNRQFEEAGKGAEKIFAPIRANALQEFGQSTLPGVLSQFGDAGLGRSSALTQALAAARTNLSRQLASDFAGIQSNLASGIVNQKYSNIGQMGQLAGSSPLSYADQYLASGKGPNRAKGAISGAIQGGMQGFAVGGPWGALGGAVLGGAGGYAGAQGDYGQAGAQGGQWLRNKINPVQGGTSAVGGMNQMGE